MTLKKLILCLASSAFLSIGGAASAEEPLWLRYPSISPDGSSIAFTYRGDIYRVSASGGDAVRLTSSDAYESRPIWSPDGQQIAFTSDRSGLGTNIYIMPSAGGKATMLTTHSGTETPYSFSPDGRYIIFKAQIQDDAKSTLFPSRSRTELYRVSVTGGRPERVLGIPSEYAQMSSDGKRLIFQDYKGAENEWRKHHTSSIARDIVEYDFNKDTFRHLTTNKGEDRNPVYSTDGRSFYYLSERPGQTMNVYKKSLDGSDQGIALTKLTGEPVRFLSIAQGDKLCFTHDGGIYTLTPGATPIRLAINIVDDADEGNISRFTFSRGLRESVVSIDGAQIAFTMRGDVFVTSADYTTTKRITHSPAVERGLTFSPDAKSLVYVSVRDGRFDLYRATMTRREDPNFSNATLISEHKLLPNIKGEKNSPQYSPDGKEIAFVLDRKKLVVYNFASKQLRELTDGSQMQEFTGEIEYTWSPDGKWIALSYVARAHAPYSDIGLVSTKGGEPVHNLTNSGYFCYTPRWSHDGNVLLYSTDRYGMRNHASWGSMNDVMAIFLNRATYEKYKMTEEEYSLLQQAEKANKPSEQTAPNNKSKKGKQVKGAISEKSKNILVELDGIEYREVRLTPNSSDLGDFILSADNQKLYYFSSVEQKYDLWVYDLRKHTAKLLKKVDAARASLFADKSGKTIYILGDQPMKLDTKGDTFKNMNFSAKMVLDRAKEREVMFDEVEREEGLRFYRADMHGVDWYALTKHYRRYLPHITNNYDFAEMLSELLGELNVSHTGSGYRAASSVEPTGELGLFFAETKGRDGLIVDEVIAGGPFDNSRTKLLPGDILLSIDGVEIKDGMDYFPLLNGKVGKSVLISYQSAKAGTKIEEVVKPISATTLHELLYRRWIKQRADMVERLSNGQLGYVHIPSMGDPSFRSVYADALGKYYGRKGIVIDIRHNGGGRLHEDIEVFFTGQKYLQQEIRGKDYCEMPSRRWNHASIMLVCEDDYSNAHGTPWVYQKMKIGKVVGMPVPGTMTSVNWVTLQDPSLYFGIPAVGYRTAEGTYLENTQLEPDVIAPLDPNKALRGEDTQLETAVRTLLNDLNLR